MVTEAITGLAGTMDEAALFRLMTWLSPSYPVGAYTYSHGLEWAVEAGDIRSADDLTDWIGSILAHGGGRNDAILFAHAHRAAAARDGGTLAEIAELAAALASSAERHLETTQQGNAFLQTTRTVWPCVALELLADVLGGPAPYPVAVAAAAAGHGIALQPALTAYLHAFAANLVSAGVRLVPLGQTDGQHATAALLHQIEPLAAEACSAELEDLGGLALRADLAAMHHETQETRLFRS